MTAARCKVEFCPARGRSEKCRVPRYETYDVLDDNQLTAFLSREARRLNILQLGPC